MGDNTGAGASATDGGLALLEEQHDGVLLRVLGELAPRDQEALASVSTRLRRLYRSEAAWGARLAGRFLLTPDEHTLLAATVARLGAPTNPPERDRVIDSASPRRIYEYLAANEAASLRFPIGYERIDTRTMAAAATRAGLVALRTAGGAAPMTLDLDVAPPEGLVPDWRTLHTAARGHTYFGGAALDGAAVLLAETGRDGAAWPVVTLVDTREAVRDAASTTPLSPLHTAVALQPSPEAAALVATAAERPGHRVRANCIGSAWATSWLAVVYRMSLPASAGTLGFVDDVHVLFRSEDGGGTPAWAPMGAGVSVAAGAGDASNNRGGMRVVGALDETRLLLNPTPDESEGTYAVVDVATGRVALRSTGIDYFASHAPQHVVAAPGTVATLSARATSDYSEVAELSITTTDGGDDGDGMGVLEETLPGGSDDTQLFIATAAGRRLWVSADEWVGVYAQRRPAEDDVWVLAASAGALAFDAEGAEHITSTHAAGPLEPRTVAQARALDWLAGLTVDLAHAWTGDGDLWRATATRVLVSAELDGSDGSDTDD